MKPYSSSGERIVRYEARSFRAPCSPFGRDLLICGRASWLRIFGSQPPIWGRRNEKDKEAHWHHGPRACSPAAADNDGPISGQFDRREACPLEALLLTAPNPHRLFKFEPTSILAPD